MTWQRCSCLTLLSFAVFTGWLFAQSTSASISGRVADQSGAAVRDAKIAATNIATNTTSITETNGAGFYNLTGLKPGTYRVTVEREGFAQIVKPDVVLHVQDNAGINFALQVGSVTQSITVEAGAPMINTTDGSVSTVVDHQFVENTPLNGRSFQSLIELTPGVVVTPTSDRDSGQFSVNGQRASANYFMVDGVSANIGSSSNLLSTQTVAGSIPGFSVLGGTNNLVSVDAVHEFRIQTSSYAPEFGRTPGAQVSLETRSGTNQFHGTAFDYLRNDVLDASDWFNGTTNPPLKKSEERQNDFGGVLGGPILRDKTFFFFSYEGQSLRLPRTALSEVPSLAVRQDPNTPAAILPLLNAFPLPNQRANAAEAAAELAPFDASFSDRSTLNATSLRIDHHVNDKLSLFGRVNYSPSDLIGRGNGTNQPLNQLTRFAVTTETSTLGAVWSPSPAFSNDVRFNYSGNHSRGLDSLDTFGGAIVPSNAFMIPGSFSGASSVFSSIALGLSSIRIGPKTDSRQRQVNVVESAAWQKGTHSLKFGADYRRLFPTVVPFGQDGLVAAFADVASAVLLQPAVALVTRDNPIDITFQNLGAYAQDTWKMAPRLTLTYGIRWDVDFVPSLQNGQHFLAITNVSTPDAIAIAPAGTPLFHTGFSNFAPRIGAAYRLFGGRSRQTILRGGFGLFYDLATQQIGDLFSGVPSFPFGASKLCTIFSTTCQLTGFPFSPSVTQLPPIAFNNAFAIAGVNPDLHLPRIWQWNVAVEQSLGDGQTLSASYVGAIGRDLVQQEALSDFNNPTAPFWLIVGNAATSDYHAVQLQFNRRISHGLQMLAGYTWSHSIDTGSTSSLFFGSTFGPGLSRNFNRGSSDFDIRHGYSLGATYNIPAPSASRFWRSIASGWAVDNMLQGRSAPPVDVIDPFAGLQLGVSETFIRPDLVPSQPLYLKGVFPGGKAINPAAFTDPPIDPVTFLPLREGDLGRNALRGFGAFQWDAAVRRTFAFGESLHLEFRAEFFNLLNHPNFANPSGQLGLPQFGMSTAMLNRGLSTSDQAGTGFSPLYQIGGPRSGQLAVKLLF
jgi:hypothetical protein